MCRANLYRLTVLSLAVFTSVVQAGGDKDFARGLVAIEKEDWDLAVVSFSRVLERDPDNQNAWYNRATAHYNKELWDKAITDYSNVLRLKPRDVETYYWRGNTFYNKKAYDRAVADFSEVLRLKPEHKDTRYWRGGAYEELRKYALALEDYREYVATYPGKAAGHAALAFSLATCPDDKLRDGKAALPIALKACKMTKRRNEDALEALAAAYAENGDFANAVASQKQAIDAHDKSKNAKNEKDFHEKMEKRLKLYEQKKPFRQ